MKFTTNEVDQLRKGCTLINVSITDAQIHQLIQYAELIMKWNKVYNLTAIKTASDMVTHHLLDCLSVLPTLDRVIHKESIRLLDIGSGAGLPGIVFALMRPNFSVVVLDAVQKKTAFMRQAVAELGLNNVAVVHNRIEQYQPNFEFNCITARAFSSLFDLIEYSSHLLQKDGMYMAMKGQHIDHEKLPASFKVVYVEQLSVPFLNEVRHVYQITR